MGCFKESDGIWYISKDKNRLRDWNNEVVWNRTFLWVGVERMKEGEIFVIILYLPLVEKTFNKEIFWLQCKGV